MSKHSVYQFRTSTPWVNIVFTTSGPQTLEVKKNENFRGGFSRSRAGFSRSRVGFTRSGILEVGQNRFCDLLKLRFQGAHQETSGVPAKRLQGFHDCHKDSSGDPAKRLQGFHDYHKDSSEAQQRDFRGKAFQCLFYNYGIPGWEFGITTVVTKHHLFTSVP